MVLPPLVVVEIGTAKVRVLIAEALEDHQLLVTGLGECESRGVRKAEIVDFDNALSCLRFALDAAEEQAQVHIHEAYLVVSGGHIQGSVNRGQIAVTDPEREITAEEIERVKQVARALSLPPEREVLHTIAQHYYVDDQQGVINPEGMEGSRLALDMLVIYGVFSRLRNSVKLVKSAEVDVIEMAFGGLCAAQAVLTPEQKESGVTLLDLGGGTTDYVIYDSAAIADAGSLTVGGDHLTNDIALGLNIPLGQAERLKREAGKAQRPAVAESQRVSLAPEGGFPGKTVRLSDLYAIISARQEETMSLVRERLRALQLLPRMGAGVVLTGGGSRLRHVTDLATRVFGLPCHIGCPRQVSGLAAATNGPECAALVGMARLGLRQTQRGKGRTLLHRFVDLFSGRP